MKGESHTKTLFVAQKRKNKEKTSGLVLFLVFSFFEPPKALSCGFLILCGQTLLGTTLGTFFFISPFLSHQERFRVALHDWQAKGQR